MKKTTTLLTILLLIFIGIQETKAQTEGPTEEETIDWIKEKLSKYLNNGWESPGYFRNINVTPCKISWVNPTDDERYIKYHSLDPTNTGNWEVTKSSDGTLLYLKPEVAGSYVVKYDSDNLAPYNKSIRLISGEPNIGERMVKAFNHLASFCTKEKEVF